MTFFLQNSARLLAVQAAIVGLSGLVLGCGGASPTSEVPILEGRVIHEETSAFSTIRVRELGSYRSLIFVEPSGEEVRQTCLDIQHPEMLQAPYTQYFFSSLVIKHPQDRILIVGMGGGAMVHFVRKYSSSAHIDAVEIDPTVVKVARDYFGIRPGPRLLIHVEDAFDFIDRSPPAKYDAIYMDAFLEPGEDTGREGIPTRLRTIEFLQQVREMLRPDGVVVFNLIRNPDTRQNIRTIDRALGVVYRFDVPDTRNVVVVASASEKKIPRYKLKRTAAELDDASGVDFSFSHMLKSLRH